MKQKIVIKIHMHCKKCRSKAMQIAVKACGVTKVEIQGAEKDQLVVIGDDVDAVNLTRSLRKGLHYASLLSVQEEKDKKDKDKDKEKEKEKEKPKEKPPPIQCSSMCYNPYPTAYQVVACDPYPNACSIL